MKIDFLDSEGTKARVWRRVGFLWLRKEAAYVHLRATVNYTPTWYFDVDDVRCNDVTNDWLNNHRRWGLRPTLPVVQVVAK